MYMSNIQLAYTPSAYRRKTVMNQRTIQKKLFRPLMLIAIMSLCFGFGALSHAYAGNHNKPVQSSAVEKQTVYVQQGDTLWTIASAHISSQADLREYVYKIKRINGLNSSVLHAGQQLVMP